MASNRSSLVRPVRSSSSDSPPPPRLRRMERSKTLPRRFRGISQSMSDVESAEKEKNLRDAAEIGMKLLEKIDEQKQKEEEHEEVNLQLRAEVSELQAKVERLMRERTKLIRDNSELTESVYELENARDSLERCQLKVRRQAATIDQLRMEYQTLQNHAEERALVAVADVRRRLSTRVEQLEAELRENRREMQLVREQSEQALQRDEATIEDLQRELSAERTARRKQQLAFSSLQHSVRSQEEQWQREREEDKETLAAMDDHNDALSNQVSQLSVALQHSEAQLNSLRLQLAAVSPAPSSSEPKTPAPTPKAKRRRNPSLGDNATVSSPSSVSDASNGLFVVVHSVSSSDVAPGAQSSDATPDAQSTTPTLLSKSLLEELEDAVDDDEDDSDAHSGTHSRNSSLVALSAFSPSIADSAGGFSASPCAECTKLRSDLRSIRQLLHMDAMTSLSASKRRSLSPVPRSRALRALTPTPPSAHKRSQSLITPPSVVLPPVNMDSAVSEEIGARTPPRSRTPRATDSKGTTTDTGTPGGSPVLHAIPIASTSSPAAARPASTGANGIAVTDIKIGVTGLLSTLTRQRQAEQRSRQAVERMRAQLDCRDKDMRLLREQHNTKVEELEARTQALQTNMAQQTRAWGDEKRVLEGKVSMLEQKLRQEVERRSTSRCSVSSTVSRVDVWPVVPTLPPVGQGHSPDVSPSSPTIDQPSPDQRRQPKRGSLAPSAHQRRLSARLSEHKLSPMSLFPPALGGSQAPLASGQSASSKPREVEPSSSPGDNMFIVDSVNGMMLNSRRSPRSQRRQSTRHLREMRRAIRDVYRVIRHTRFAPLTSGDEDNTDSAQHRA